MTADVTTEAFTGPYDLTLPPETLVKLKQLFVNRKNRRKARKNAEIIAVAAFRAAHPEPVSKTEIRALMLELNAEMTRLERLLEKRGQTSEATELYRMVPFRELSFFDRAMGGVAAVTLAVAMLTMPAIAGISIYSAEKFELLSRIPALSMIFGLSPFAGVLSAVAWRGKLGSDQARTEFDQTLIKSTVVVLIIWSIIAAFTAYPIGGNAAPDSGYRDNPDKGFSLIIAPSILLIWTAILDLVAAPTLHMIVEDKLFKKQSVGACANPEMTHLNDTLIPAVRRDISQLTAKLKALRSIRKQHKNAEVAAVQHVLIELDGVEGQIRAAHSQASASLFN